MKHNPFDLGTPEEREADSKIEVTMTSTSSIQLINLQEYIESREKEFEEDFQFQQKKIWQLPENTILERQTITLIHDFSKSFHSLTIKGILDIFERMCEEMKLKESHIGIGGLYTAEVQMEVNSVLSTILKQLSDIKSKL